MPESFIVRALGQQPENSITPVSQIPPQRDVVLEAIGGDGEPGRLGGDGSPGRNGIAGIDATRVLDATVCFFPQVWNFTLIRPLSLDQMVEMEERKLLRRRLTFED